MSTGRLTFLYPHLFRSVRVGESTVKAARQCRHGLNTRRVAFATTSRSKDQFVQRHGKAVEPLPVIGEAKESTKGPTPEDAASSEMDDVNGDGSKEPGGGMDSDIERITGAKSPGDSPSVALLDGTQTASYVPEDLPSGDKTQDTADSQSQADTTSRGDGPLEKVLQMELPAEFAADLKLPHLHPPPFVHTFDTYSLVKDIEAGGFTNEQAITAMKALRVLLAKNLEVAKEGLVSKSDVENESYLFRAACSELQTEIQNTRRANEEKMRRDRTFLQHEVEILNQKLTQELLSLKDDLNGMFNDRKMAVRMEQRAMQSAIQELNYKITVALNSDAKSEVEGLRWVLSRRSVLAIVFMALMVLSSLRYASYRAHEEVEQQRLEKLREQEIAERRNRKGGSERMADGEALTEAGKPKLESRDLHAGSAAEALTAN